MLRVRALLKSSEIVVICDYDGSSSAKLLDFGETCPLKVFSLEVTGESTN